MKNVIHSNMRNERQYAAKTILVTGFQLLLKKYSPGAYQDLHCRVYVHRVIYTQKQDIRTSVKQNENVPFETASLVIPGLMYASVTESAYKEVHRTAYSVVQAWELKTDYIFQKTRGKDGAQVQEHQEISNS